MGAVNLASAGGGEVCPDLEVNMLARPDEGTALGVSKGMLDYTLRATETRPT